MFQGAMADEAGLLGGELLTDFKVPMGKRIAQLARAKHASWPVRKAAIGCSMMTHSLRKLPGRLSAIRFVGDISSVGTEEGAVGPIWQFWAQGLDQAPALVRTCMASVEANAGGRQRILLTSKTVGDYLDIPGEVHDRLEKWGWTKFSNLLRLMLLETHGGTWVDATVLFGKPMPAEISHSEFFAFQWDHDPRIVATWFLHARSGHPLIAALREAYVKFWMQVDRPIDYFMFHHIFEALITSDARLADLWRHIPFQHAASAHELQALLAAPFDEARMRGVVDRCWLQKLSYKPRWVAHAKEGSFHDVVGQDEFRRIWFPGAVQGT